MPNECKIIWCVPLQVGKALLPCNTMKFNDLMCQKGAYIYVSRHIVGVDNQNAKILGTHPRLWSALIQETNSDGL